MTKTKSIFSYYDELFAASLQGRYITLEHLKSTIEMMCSDFEYSIIGSSENGIEIPMIRIGKGAKKVLAWSQMHGNESTTTKAVMDFISLCSQRDHFQKEISTFLEQYSLYVIPILNPDGALLYTRENINGIDLNRDAKLKSQKESKALATVFENIRPDLCLNLHDQRTIYGAADGLPATISFLSPSADKDRTVTGSRRRAMNLIAQMACTLEAYIPGQVGRYHDAFNENCVGDTFQMSGIPTILFEAGHYPNDYDRDKTRKYVFLALLELFELEPQGSGIDIDCNYNDIPENNKSFRDVVLRNFVCPNSGSSISMALQYEEVLKDKNIQFKAVIDELGSDILVNGHKEVDLNGAQILVDSQEKLEKGQYVSMVFDKNDHSVVYFSMK